MDDNVMILRSDDYRKEEAALLVDPIVIGMAEAIRHLNLSNEEMKSFKFMGDSLREYERRSGKEPKTIGSVANAIRSLLNES